MRDYTELQAYLRTGPKTTSEVANAFGLDRVDVNNLLRRAVATEHAKKIDLPARTLYVIPDWFSPEEGHEYPYHKNVGRTIIPYLANKKILAGYVKFTELICGILDQGEGNRDEIIKALRTVNKMIQPSLGSAESDRYDDVFGRSYGKTEEDDED